MTHQEILEAMGSAVSDVEADTMKDILIERGITELSEIGDAKFFALIPEAIERAAASWLIAYLFAFFVLAQMILQANTQRGLLHWLGIGLILASGAIDILGRFFIEAALELADRTRATVEARLAEHVVRQ